MLYRVPAELDFLLPAYPVDSTPQSRPWKGNLLWKGADNDPQRHEQQLAFVHAVETEGDIRADIWPQQLSLRTSKSGFSLSSVHAWVKDVAPPLCMLMPGSNADPKLNRANQNNFRNFSKLLKEKQVVAISRWRDPRRIPGSGIIVFPVEATDGLLAAAVFHSRPIPEFTSSGQSQALSTPYGSEFSPAPQSPLSPIDPQATAPWSSYHQTNPVSSAPSLAVGSNLVWNGTGYRTPSYAVPRGHYLHTQVPTLDQLEGFANSTHLSSPTTATSPPETIDFDWGNRQRQLNDAQDFNYNAISAADPDWSFLNATSAYTLTSP